MAMKKKPGENSNPLSNDRVNKKAADYSRAKLQAKSEARRKALGTISAKGVGINRP